MKKKVETIIIVCDNCGEHFVNGYGFTCYTDDPDGGNMLSEATSSGWLDIDGRQYCPDCWHYDDDDNIVCRDGRKYNGNTHEPVIEGVNAADGTAQDGDILMAGECIFIYKGIDTEEKFGGTNTAIIYHACTNINDGHTSIGPYIGVGGFGSSGYIYRKAYKDECEHLFAKLKAMGFEWDAEKKDIVKIKED